LREALKGVDVQAILSRMNELAASLQKVGTAAYQAASPTGGDGNGSAGAPPEGEPAGAAAGGGEEEAVEGEFKEV
jgi:hypothetical protein